MSTSPENYPQVTPDQKDRDAISKVCGDIWHTTNQKAYDEWCGHAVNLMAAGLAREMAEEICYSGYLGSLMSTTLVLIQEALTDFSLPGTGKRIKPRQAYSEAISAADTTRNDDDWLKKLRRANFKGALDHRIKASD